MLPWVGIPHKQRLIDMLPLSTLIEYLLLFSWGVFQWQGVFHGGGLLGGGGISHRWHRTHSAALPFGTACFRIVQLFLPLLRNSTWDSTASWVSVEWDFFPFQACAPSKSRDSVAGIFLHYFCGTFKLLSLGRQNTCSASKSPNYIATNQLFSPERNWLMLHEVPSFVVTNCYSHKKVLPALVDKEVQKSTFLFSFCGDQASVLGKWVHISALHDTSSCCLSVQVTSRFNEAASNFARFCCLPKQSACTKVPFCWCHHAEHKLLAEALRPEYFHHSELYWERWCDHVKLPWKVPHCFILWQGSCMEMWPQVNRYCKKLLLSSC